MIHGNFQQGDNLVKSVEAGMPAPVLNVHDGVWNTIYKLRGVFLCPALFLSFVLDPLTQSVEVRNFAVLVHFHIILYYFTLRVTLRERNKIIYKIAFCFINKKDTSGMYLDNGHKTHYTIIIPKECKQSR